MIQITYPDGSLSGYTETAQFSTFSGGEEHVNLKSAYNLQRNVPIQVKAQITSSKDVMQLFLVTDALRRVYCNALYLQMPYLPYARQDRVCTPGDAFSLAAFARMLNTQEYDQITVFDAHSPIAEKLINTLYSIPQHAYCDKVFIQDDRYPGQGGIDYIVSPDKGAEIKAMHWHSRALLAQNAKLAVGSKIRDPKDGSITGTDIDVEDFQGGSCLIVDDICDGGRTFIELAKVMKERNAGKIYLYVSHGIFSKGAEPLIEAGISHIYTTDSFPQKEHPAVTIVHKFFKGETE